MTLLALLVVFGIIASGVFSGVETAFVACPRLKVRHLAKRGVRAALRMEAALRSPGPYLTSLLVGTNMAVVGGTVAATRLAEHFCPGRGELIATLALTPVFLVVSEILPKSYFLAHARTLWMHLAQPLNLMRTILYPIGAVVGIPARMITRSKDQFAIPASREELTLLAQPGVSSIRLSAAIRHVLEARVASAHQVAGEIMIPRDRVVSLPANASRNEASALVRSTRLTHYPLERDNQWIGFVHVFDLIDAPSDGSLAALASPLPHVDQESRLQDVIDTMRAASEHVVAVVHEQKQVGVITLEDVVTHLTLGLSQ